MWVAIDDATPEKGCMRFACGTHDRVRTIKFGGEEGFYEAAYTLDFNEADQPCVVLPVKAGQFIIFTERCIHGSGPNTTDQHRLAFNLRVIGTNVPAYTNKKYYRSVYNGGKYNLDKWGVAVLRGEDRLSIEPGDSSGRPRDGRLHPRGSRRRAAPQTAAPQGRLTPGRLPELNRESIKPANRSPASRFQGKGKRRHA